MFYHPQYDVGAHLVGNCECAVWERSALCGASTAVLSACCRHKKLLAFFDKTKCRVKPNRDVCLALRGWFLYQFLGA